MKALVYKAPQTLSFDEVIEPIADEGEVIIRVDTVGICGSDMHAYLGHDDRRPAPLILGHEAAGQIKNGAHKDKRVTINPLVSCGTCEFCHRGAQNLCLSRQIISMPPREGAFAEFVKIPFKNLIEVPDNVSLDKAALAEPIACGWSAVRKCSNFLGERFNLAKAIVIGGGAIGVGAALSLIAQGVGSVIIIEPQESRRKFIQGHIGLEAVAETSSAPQFDIVIDGVGVSATRSLSSLVVKAGGIIAHIGLGSSEGGLDARRITLQGISFFGCYTYTPADFRETANAIFDGSLGALDWVHFRALSEGAKAFEDLQNGFVTHPKILLKP